MHSHSTDLHGTVLGQLVFVLNAVGARVARQIGVFVRVCAARTAAKHARRSAPFLGLRDVTVGMSCQAENLPGLPMQLHAMQPAELFCCARRGLGLVQHSSCREAARKVEVRTCCGSSPMEGCRTFAHDKTSANVRQVLPSGRSLAV